MYLSYFVYNMQHKNKQVNLELWQEAQIYGDIQLMPFVDYYSLITLKTVAVCILGVCFLLLMWKILLLSLRNAYLSYIQVYSRPLV